MGTFQIVQVVQSKAPRALQFRGSSLVSQDLRLNAHQTLELQRVGKKTPLREVLLHMFTVSKNSDIRVSGTFLQGRPEGLTDEENPDSALNLPVEIIEWNDRSLMDMLEEYGQRYNLIIQIKADDHGRFVSVIERTKRNDIDEPIYEDQTTNWRVEQNQRTNYGNVSVWNINENYEQERTEASVAAPGQTWTPSFLASDGAGGCSTGTVRIGGTSARRLESPHQPACGASRIGGRAHYPAQGVQPSHRPRGLAHCQGHPDHHPRPGLDDRGGVAAGDH